ncbi:Uncharacterised protein r2_g4335 [Pycnogonum litorale]
MATALPKKYSTAEDLLNAILTGSDVEISDEENDADTSVVPEIGIANEALSSDGDNTAAAYQITATKTWTRTVFSNRLDVSVTDDNFSEVLSPSVYFSKYFPPDFWNHVSYQTNLYCVQKNGSSVKTTPEEIRKLTGLHMLSGIFRYPQMRMYWNRLCKVDVIADQMTRDRFF